VSSDGTWDDYNNTALGYGNPGAALLSTFNLLLVQEINEVILEDTKYKPLVIFIFVISIVFVAIILLNVLIGEFAFYMMIC
jgi:hypothetical protein